MRVNPLPLRHPEDRSLLELWDAGRITVTSGAGVLAAYLAESVTGAMIVLARGFLQCMEQQHMQQQRARRWKPAWFTPLEGRRTPP